MIDVTPLTDSTPLIGDPEATLQGLLAGDGRMASVLRRNRY